MFPTKKSVKVTEMSFADGLFEAQPPSAGVYPTKKKYNHSQYEELGIIDCRITKSIVVKAI